MSLLSNYKNKIKELWQNDWAASWARFQMKVSAFLAAAMGFIQVLNSYVQDPTFKTYLDSLQVSKEVYFVIALIGILSFLSLPSR